MPKKEMISPDKTAANPYSTDADWEKWGATDPYFGVITDGRFRSSRLDEQALQEFFLSGAHHVNHVLQSISRYTGTGFIPNRVLDFGCGVGRVLIHFAFRARQVVGVDVSKSMLAEAQRQMSERGLSNAELIHDSDELLGVDGQFDLVHSVLVLQHLDVQRGTMIFGLLIDKLAPNGVAALQLTYGKAQYETTLGSPPAGFPGHVEAAVSTKPSGTARQPGRGAGPQEAAADPMMQMNPYLLNTVFFQMQRRGVKEFHAEFTDHGGELGVFLFFKKP